MALGRDDVHRVAAVAQLGCPIEVNFFYCLSEDFAQALTQFLGSVAEPFAELLIISARVVLEVDADGGARSGCSVVISRCRGSNQASE